VFLVDNGPTLLLYSLAISHTNTPIFLVFLKGIKEKNKLELVKAAIGNKVHNDEGGHIMLQCVSSALA
jgi:hypothetical protein